MLLRARYCGPNDLTTGFCLQRAETVINSFDPASTATEINDILEYYNIIRFFDNKLYLNSWNEPTIANYTAIVHQFRAVVGRFFHGVRGESLNDLYEQLDFQMKESFFSALSKYRVTERITPEQLSAFIDKQPQAMGLILQEKKFVKMYGQEIANELTKNVNFATFVLNHYYVKQDRSQKTYMPDELGQEQRKKIIENYVDWDQANTNYLSLISGLKKTDDFTIDERIRFRAHKRVVAFWEKHFSTGGSSFKVGVNVEFRDQEQVALFKPNSDENVPSFMYSNHWISDNLDYPTLLNNFIYLFQYTDLSFRCQFLSNPNDMSAIERLAGVHGKNDYSAGIGYRFQDMSSSLQMLAYRNVLQRNGIEIESLFKWFFEDYLNSEFGIDNYHYCTPTPQASDLEKILLMASQIDAVLKQYRLYLEDGNIDRELFEFSSFAYKIADTPSMIEKKYLYPVGKTMQSRFFYLFNDQSLMGITEETGDKYQSLVELLVNENVSFSSYEGFELNVINWLIGQTIVSVDDFGFLHLEQPITDILFDLYKNGSLVYSYRSMKEKELLEKMIKAGELEAESKLFTKQEQQYIDYMLNVQQFNNGPELRNKYVHGTFALDEQIHQMDYVEMLKIMTLIVIKINEEFCLAFPTDKQ